MNNNNLEILETGLIVTASLFGSEFGGDIGDFIQLVGGVLALYKMVEMTYNLIIKSRKEKRERRKEKREQEEHAIKMKKHELELKQLDQKINKEK